MTIVTLVRHGQASFGADDYDVLSGLGRLQSRRLGRVLSERGERFEAVFAGTLRRHHGTVSECLSAWAGPRVWSVRPGLNEFDHRDLLERLDPRYADLRRLRDELATAPDGDRALAGIFRRALSRWMDGLHDADYALSWRCFSEEACATIDAVARSGASCLAVTSGGVIAALAQRALDLNGSAAAALQWRLANTGLTRLRASASGRLRLLTLNDYSHLSGEHEALLSWR